VQETITHENAEFVDGVELSAKDMARLADDRFNNQQFEDVAYFEPFYLKEFIATKPRKNIIQRMRPGQ
jgi:tRNA threonylcarbamoyladenosine biosynthesis protein TsaB